MFFFQIPPSLSADEEKSLAVRVAQGDKNARDKLVLANLPFVVHCSKAFRGYGLCDDELIEEGTIGLLEAINHFDVTKGFRLATYAKFWIRRAILKALNECGASIRLSEDKARTVVKLRKGMADSRSWRNSCEQMQYIASLAGCKEEEARRLLALAQLPERLDAPVRGEDSESRYALLADSSKSLEDVFVENDMQECIRRAVSALKANEREVVMRHYGLTGAEPQTFSQIALVTGRTKARMQQIEQNAFKKLRESLRAIS